MEAAIALDTELGNAADAAASMADASHDATKLPRAMVASGVGEAAAALYLALFKSPAGLFHRTDRVLYSYYGVLTAVVLFWVADKVSSGSSSGACISIEHGPIQHT
jgi:hypothetical protein